MSKFGGVFYHGNTKADFISRSIICSFVWLVLLHFGIFGFYMGVQIELSVEQEKYTRFGSIVKICGLLGAVILLLPVLRTFPILKGLFGGSLILSIAVYGIIIFLSLNLPHAFVSKKGMRILYNPENRNALKLETLPIFEYINSNLEDAEYFVVSYDGIYLYNSAKYCYMAVKYNHFGLGNLENINEIGLLGLYFVQKYGRKYTFKIEHFTEYEKEHIVTTDTPGNEMDLKSYIFYKNKEK